MRVIELQASRAMPQAQAQGAPGPPRSPDARSDWRATGARGRGTGRRAIRTWIVCLRRPSRRSETVEPDRPVECAQRHLKTRIELV